MRCKQVLVYFFIYTIKYTQIYYEKLKFNETEAHKQTVHAAIPTQENIKMQCEITA